MSGAVQEARTAVMILVEAAWLDQSGEAQSVTARMENQSSHGACIRMKKPVAVGKRLYIQSHRDQFSGIAKYCRVDGKEFLVGIHRDSVNQPAPRKPAQTNVLTPQTEREAERPSEAAAEKLAEASIPPLSGQVKAGAPFKNKSGPRQMATAQSETSAARDAKWSAARLAEPQRESVPHRVKEQKAHNGNSGHTAHIARIEEPIAARLLEQDARRTETPHGEPVRNPSLPVVANPAPQVQTGNGSEKKGKKKGRGIMKLKWFAGDEQELLGANGGNNAPGEPVQRAAEAAPRLERGLERGTERAAAKPAAVPSGESAGGFEAELLPVEDIYRAAGITSPRRGYSVSKVVEMLRSEHLRGASRELRRAAVLMALDAAGVSVDEVLQDAKVRQEAIDAYAMEQRKHAEAQWARKAEENLQIQAELELVKAHYGERIRRNLDGVAREKATFGSWLKMKEQETQGMAEAVEQVLKAPAASEAAADSLLSVTVSSATGKPV